MRSTSQHVARSRATGRALVALAALLAAASISVAVWQLWPETSWTLGLVRETWPYRSSVGPSTAGDAIPTDNRLVIPRIAVDVPVLEGDPDRALSLGVYHHPETGLPGEADGNVLAGHRNRRALALLSRLKTGDPVLLYWNGVEYVYRVKRQYVTTPDDAEVLAPSSTEELRMYTCLPRWLGNKRTVVVAVPDVP